MSSKQGYQPPLSPIDSRHFYLKFRLLFAFSKFLISRSHSQCVYNFNHKCDNAGFTGFALQREEEYNTSHLNLNGLLVIRQIDNTSPWGCTRREISPWLSQEMRTWTHQVMIWLTEIFFLSSDTESINF